MVPHKCRAVDLANDRAGELGVGEALGKLLESHAQREPREAAPRTNNQDQIPTTKSLRLRGIASFREVSVVLVRAMLSPIAGR
jgi:hypothetical protein